MGLSAAISASLAREFLSVSPEGGDELDPRMAVVTGLGTINPLGGDVASTWAALHESRCAVRGLDVSWLQGLELPVTIAAPPAVEPTPRLSHQERLHLEHANQGAPLAGWESCPS